LSTQISADQITLSDKGAEQRTQIIRRELWKLGRHDWSLWALAVVIILSLTAAVTTLSTSVVSQASDPFYEFHISQSVRGLVGLVLVFSVYTLFQQVQLRRTRVGLAEQVGIAAQQQIRAEEFLKLAMLDPLTGLHNRRYADERLVAEIARAERFRSVLTILALDLNDLKEINDRYGHGAGDLALKVFAERLRRAIRGCDLAARVGGDEFVAFLPDCTPDQIHLVLNRLSPLEIEVQAKKVAFGFSAGFADYREGETSVELLERADEALYVQKQISKSQEYSQKSAPLGFSNGLQRLPERF
jgi:diguanylate cyclase